MRGLGKWLGRLLLVLVVAAGALWFFGPREPVVTNVDFDAARIGADVDAYLAGVESGFDDITPGVEKRVIWAGAPGQVTSLALVYIHGFSATSEEIRPVPDAVAEGLDANLHYTRLAGHGRGGDAMAEASVGDWMRDVAEALAVGRVIGDEVVVMATSTGATLAAVAALDEGLSDAVKGWIFVSPNFGINNPAAPLLTMPAARQILPPLVGSERSFEPQGEDHGRYWTTRYPTVAVLPMAALVQHANTLDYTDVPSPALFFISDADRVVVPGAGRDIAGRWGAGAEVIAPVMGPGDDPYSHVTMGDILSPGQNDDAIGAMIRWIAGL